MKYTARDPLYFNELNIGPNSKVQLGSGLKVETRNLLITIFFKVLDTIAILDLGMSVSQDPFQIYYEIKQTVGQILIDGHVLDNQIDKLYIYSVRQYVLRCNLVLLYPDILLVLFY